MLASYIVIGSFPFILHSILHHNDRIIPSHINQSCIIMTGSPPLIFQSIFHHNDRVIPSPLQREKSRSMTDLPQSANACEPDKPVSPADEHQGVVRSRSYPHKKTLSVLTATSPASTPGSKTSSPQSYSPAVIPRRWGGGREGGREGRWGHLSV